MHLIVKWLKWFNACEDTDTLKIEYEDSDSDDITSRKVDFRARTRDP